MGPYNEQRLRDEVIYLHSLWHHGHHSPSSTINLQPLNPTRFKKPKKKTPKFQPKKPNAGKFSGKEWPVKPPAPDPPLNQSGWPELKLKPNPQTTRVPTPEELEKHKWNQVQQRALKAVKDFYFDEDDDDGEEEDDMSEDEDDVGDKGYDFFWKMVDGDEELKGYYLNHCGGGGEFSCLVCGGANEKHGKRFKDCIALVQHSVSIAKTKRIRAHRAYGKVICKVLGWDIDRLPSSIVLDHQAGELQGNDANACKDVKGVNDMMDNESSNGRTHDGAETVDGESMVCEDVRVANVEEESSKKQLLSEAEGYTGGAVNNLCRNLSSTMVLEPVLCDLQTN